MGQASRSPTAIKRTHLISHLSALTLLLSDIDPTRACNREWLACRGEAMITRPFLHSLFKPVPSRNRWHPLHEATPVMMPATCWWLLYGRAIYLLRAHQERFVYGTSQTRSLIEWPRSVHLCRHIWVRQLVLTNLRLLIIPRWFTHHITKMRAQFYGIRAFSVQGNFS